MLEQKTGRIKTLCLNLKNNFFEIGKELISIRDNESWREGYDSFTDYLNNADLGFGKQHAYKLITVYERFGDRYCNGEVAYIPLNKVISIAYVPDRKLRDSLFDATNEAYGCPQAKKPDIAKFHARNERTAQRTDAEVEVKCDDVRLKILRILRDITNDISLYKITLADLRLRLQKAFKMADKYKDDETQSVKSEMMKEWREIGKVGL